MLSCITSSSVRTFVVMLLGVLEKISGLFAHELFLNETYFVLFLKRVFQRYVPLHIFYVYFRTPTQERGLFIYFKCSFLALSVTLALLSLNPSAVLNYSFINRLIMP